MVSIKEIVLHRLRDLDAALRSDQKLRLLSYAVVRPALRLADIETDFAAWIPESKIILEGLSFEARPRTLDFVVFSRFYEPETTQYLARFTGQTFVDIGAHGGRFALLSAPRFARVLAIEPHEGNRALLERNIKRNGIENVTVVPTAASDQYGLVGATAHGMNLGAARIGAPAGANGESVWATSCLDDTLKELQVSASDVELVLVDVEGHELQTLRGARNLLKDGSPTLIVESFARPALDDLLRPWGYARVGTLDFYNQVYRKTE